MTSTAAAATTAARLAFALDWLQSAGSQAGRDGMLRYALPSERAFGVSVAHIQVLARQLGRDHALALALWKTGWFEARMLCAFVDEPARVSAAQMERWSRDFDNWGIVDTLCFHLFDRTSHAWPMVDEWASRRDEFGRRAAFALLWALALHDREAGNEPFLHGLRLIDEAAGDRRNFVRKALLMALRAIARRNRVLEAASAAVRARVVRSRVQA